MKTFAWLWPYVKKYRYQLVFAFLLVTVETILTLINPNIAGRIVDECIKGGAVEKLPTYLTAMGLVTVTFTVLLYAFRLLFESISQKIAIDIRSQVYSKLQSLDFNFFDKNNTGELLSKLTSDIDAIRYFMSYIIYAIFQFTLQLLIVIPMFMIINIPFTLCILALLPLIAIIAVKLGKEVKPAFMAIREQFSNLNSVAQENISGNRVVKAFAKEEYEIEKFEKENEEYMQCNLNASKIWRKYLPILDALANSSTAIIILLGGTFVINGGITIGDLVIFTGLTWAINNPMKMSGWLINDIQRTAAACEKLSYILSTTPRIENPTDLLGLSKVDSESTNVKVEGKIEFHNVFLKRGQTFILRDINFNIYPGQTVGIMGPTGSGKTSLANLIPRYYDSFKGEVLIDDQNVKNKDLHNLRDNISFTMQDIFLFSDTIMANIAYGIPDATLDDVKKAACIACADEFIEKMADKYDTIIGEYGVGLSGGQRQRLSLARAILKDSPILILDDTTSALDMETEHKIQTNMKNMLSSKTVIIISHKIASVKAADLILIVEAGKISDHGTHIELLSRDGYYKTTYQNQHKDDLEA